jgi:hypothetical protein
MALRHEKRVLQRSEINLGREGTSQAANFPELRNEIVALKKLEQEQKEVALRITQIEEGFKKIEAQRQENTREQNEALSELEVEKKPILQRRNEAKSAAELCERELGAVDQRIQANDAADRDLLKKLSELQVQTPPPADLEAQSAGIGARRLRLPDERAELVRARLGSADATRAAKEKLAAAESELGLMDKKIERTRAEFEARDKTLADSVASQQEALREARTHHQVVEERKNPAYLNIGRHLATQGIAPPNAPHLLTDVQRHRTAVDRHLQHRAELALLSSKIDKQELRQFYFSGVSVLALLLIALVVFSKSPRSREWLPQETDEILSINTEQFERDDLPKRWRKEQPDAWENVWNGLVGSAARTPILDLSRDTRRITRATATNDTGTMREFVLVEARGDISRVIQAVDHDRAFQRRDISGLAVWERPDLTLARVGPNTVAVGAAPEVDELVRVRLGMDLDLKITGQLFDRFQALDRESALRLISRNPPDLSRVFHPIFAPELLNNCQLLGLALNVQNPVKARLLLKMKSVDLANQFARQLREEPQRWLHLQDSDLLLYKQTPDVSKEGATVEVRLAVPDDAARLLLQRIAKSDTSTTVAGN